MNARGTDGTDDGVLAGTAAPAGDGCDLPGDGPAQCLIEGLVPAFRDTRTGETHLAMTACGRFSAVHEFSCLPDHWIVERGEDGTPSALHPAVIAGYHRFDRFIPIGSAFVLPLDG